VFLANAGDLDSPVTSSTTRIRPEQIKEALALIDADREAEARAKLSVESKPGEPAYRAKLKEVAAITRAATRLAEDGQYARAVIWVEHALNKIKEARETLPSDSVQDSLYVAATEAFLFDKILHDDVRALAAYEACLSLGSADDLLQRRTDQLKANKAAPRIYGTSTPTLNQTFASRLPKPALQVRPASTAGFQIELHADVSGSYRIETSSDLRTWTVLFRTSNVAGSFEHLDHDTEAGARFYRVFREESTATPSKE